MTGMDRIDSLMRGVLPDRVPVIANLLDQGAVQLGLSVKEYYSSHEHVVDAQLGMRERFGHDNLWAYFYSAREAELLGCRNVIWASNGPPNVGHMVIQSPADIESFEIPKNLDDHPLFLEEVACIQKLKEESAGSSPVLSAVVGSFTLPSLLMGMSRWIDLMWNGPFELRDRLLEQCSDYVSWRIDALRRAGADLIAYSSGCATMSFLRLEQFRKLALPWIKRDFEDVGTDGVIYFNAGGRINPSIPDLMEETGVGAFYINPLDNVSEAKALTGGRGLVVGPINDIKLLNWSEAEIDAAVREIMALGKPDGGFLFGTLVMPLMIPQGAIEALIKAAHRHGRYDA